MSTIIHGLIACLARLFTNAAVLVTDLTRLMRSVYCSGTVLGMHDQLVGTLEQLKFDRCVDL